MELRQYLAVVRRRWPLVASIVILTALFSGYLLFTGRSIYTATVRLSIRESSPTAPAPAPGQPAPYTYDDYYVWGSSEYMADDYAQIIPSQAFAGLVLDQLPPQYRTLSRGAIVGALTADRRHREITVAATTGDRALSTAIVEAVKVVLQQISAPDAAVPNLNGVAIHDNARFAVIDVSEQGAEASNQTRLRANAVIAVVVGLALALALAFLLEYLDTSLRDSADAERVIGLPVVGIIPGRR